MAFPALLSELFEVFHRKVGADERPARVVAEAAVFEDARFRSIDKKFDALSHTMDQRFDALSQRFDVLNQPSDGRKMPSTRLPRHQHPATLKLPPWSVLQSNSSRLI